MYSNKYMLLEESRLIYAIVNVDKSSGSLRLNCKWLDDLTKADNKMINECDLMFDKIKNNIKFFDKKRKNNFNNKENIKKNIMETIQINVDLDQIKLSSILELKKIIKENPGNIKVEVIFNAKNRHLKSYEIDPTLKINFNYNIKELIKNIKGVSSIQAP